LNVASKDLYRNIGIYYAYNKRDSSTACKYLQRYFDIVKEQTQTQEYAEANNHLGFAKLIIGDYKESVLFEAALRTYEMLEQEHKDNDVIERGKAFALRNKGYILSRNKFSADAIECAKTALSIQMRWYKLVDPTDLAENYHALGTFYMANGEYEKAVESFIAGLKHWERAEHVTQITHPVIFVTRQSLGKATSLVNKNADALIILQETYRLQCEHFKTKDHADIGKTLHFMGEVFMRMKDYRRAVETFEQAIDVKKKFHAQDSFIVDVSVKALRDAQILRDAESQELDSKKKKLKPYYIGPSYSLYPHYS
jgi:tetratricopeptide (TPR) repeat protein